MAPRSQPSQSEAVPDRESSQVSVLPSDVSDTEGAEIPSTRRFFGCYLLVSEAKLPLSKGRTYVGFTVNPSRRLRQHNGILKQGGAIRTSRHRPWRMIAVIHGFGSNTQGLQFEWAWQNPQRALSLKTHCTAHGALRLSRSGRTFPNGRLRTAAALLSVPPWSLCPLTLTITAPRERWAIYGIQDLQLPRESLRVEFRDVNELANGSVYEYRQVQDNVIPRCMPNANSGCPVCKVPVRGEGVLIGRGGNRKLTHCASCGALAHIACFADRCRARPPDDRGERNGNGTEYNDSVIPLFVKCPLCQFSMHWSLVVRLARALQNDD